MTQQAAKPPISFLRKRRLSIASACVALIGAAALFSSQRRRVEVVTASPVYEDIESSISATGTVVPLHDFSARADFSGLVNGIYVHLGEKVHPGQLLVRMKDQYAAPRVDNARAALEAAEVNNENVQNNGSREDHIAFATDLARAQDEEKSAADSLATLQRLEANGSASEAEVAAAAQRHADAGAALRALQQRMTTRYSPTDRASWEARVAADKASLQAEKVSFSNANLTSPVDGTVYLLPVSLYDFVPAGADLLHIADITKLRIDADFYEADVSKLRVGQPVRITWDGNSNKSWHGKLAVRPFALSGNGSLRTGRSSIEFEDPASDIPVNTNVTVVVTADTHRHVLTVPREAIHYEGAARFVYRVDGGRLQRTAVQVGMLNALRAEITSGLSTGDLVALHAAGNERLRDEMHVKSTGSS